MENFTFWQLINLYKIEIPVIQREYAQGRDEDKVNTIRKDFISDILKDITQGNDKKIHLGFVYGKIFGKAKQDEIQRNKVAIENVLSSVKSYATHLDLIIKTEIEEKEEDTEFLTPNFIPLDGQQRLTTLYLVHWYLANFTDDNTYEIALKLLSRFQYKSRQNALDFCTYITSNNLQETVKDNESKISERLKVNTSFYRIWENDTTVNGMLNMLDEIELQFKPYESKAAFFSKLIESIPFEFLDLNELRQTDELYVKMNARGKHLSIFENFKARLIKLTNENKKLKETIINTNWKQKFDKDWLDLFWKSNPVDSNIDSLMYNAFRQLNSYMYIARNKNVNENFVKSIRDGSYLSFRDMLDEKFFSSESLNFAFQSLDNLCNKELIQNLSSALKDIYTISFRSEKNMDKFLIEEQSNLTIPESVFHFAFLIYLDTTNIVKVDKDLSIFKTWMRVCRNLIFNTYIQNPSEYIKALKAIFKLSNNILDIDSYVKNEKNQISFFDNEQRKQEALKLSLFDKNEWKEEILNIENHSYFIADIGFILNFSKNKEQGTYNLLQFKHYVEILGALYSQEILQREDRVFYRALLCIGDYLPNVSGYNYTLCLPDNGSLRVRKNNWRKFFGDEDRVNYLKELIDLHLNKKSTIIKDLGNVINEYNKDTWEQHVINCPEAITYTFIGVGHIWFKNFEEVFLLETSKIYGYHVELRSYSFFKNHKLENGNFSYFDEITYFSNRMRTYLYPCILYVRNKKNEQELHLEITFKENQYYIQFAEKDSLAIKSTKIKNYFKNNKWSSQENVFFNNYKNEKQLKSCLNKTLKDLNELK